MLPTSATVEAARAWFAQRRGERVIVAPDRDVDGLSAGVIAVRALERLGAKPIVELPGKGEHVHSAAMRARLAGLRADALVVLDMGTRSGPIVEGLPTVVIDHHVATEIPDVTLYVSSARWDHVAPSGLLAYAILAPLVDLADCSWLALMSVIGDLGDRHPFGEALAETIAGYKKTHVRDAVSLLNAARRSASYRPDVAYATLAAASGPADIAKGLLPGVADLQSMRAEVTAEVTRVARTAPKVKDNVALIRFSSGAQIHPLIATRWAPRLAPKIVIAANDNYLPGRVNFAMRSASNVDLVAFLRGLGLGAVDGEFANGHPRATGGSVPPHEFERILRALGY